MADKRWTCDHDIDAFLETMELPSPAFMAKLAAERAPIEAAAPQPGDPAPGFSVERLSADGRRSGEFVSLGDFRGRQLALIFGSYTCPVYRGQTQRLNEIFTELHDRLEFLLVYIAEAHPEDGWQVGINHTQQVIYTQPTAPDERAAIAGDCIRACGITMPAAIDGMDNAANRSHSGSPERLYLIDCAGMVRHRSGPGPFNMTTIDAWYAALGAV